VTRWLLLLAFACRSHDAAPPPPKADPLMRAVVRPVPPGPYQVSYVCTQPSASGKASGTSDRLDLGAMTRTTSSGDETLDAPAVANVSPALVAMIADNVNRVLAGGPYRAELPAAGAPGCMLTIEKGEQKLLTIEKADTKERDAVSELVHAFRP
jgi:hypothetical protein